MSYYKVKHRVSPNNLNINLNVPTHPWGRGSYLFTSVFPWGTMLSSWLVFSRRLFNKWMNKWPWMHYTKSVCVCICSYLSNAALSQKLRLKTTIIFYLSPSLLVWDLGRTYLSSSPLKSLTQVQSDGVWGAVLSESQAAAGGPTSQVAPSHSWQVVAGSLQMLCAWPSPWGWLVSSLRVASSPGGDRSGCC